MESTVAIEKCLSITSRDFRAESEEKDGTHFHVAMRYNVSTEVRAWWEEHYTDNGRTAFNRDEYSEGMYLVCHDETEAMALVTQLQQELNRSLV